MGPKSDNIPELGTDKLNKTIGQPQLSSQPEVKYRPMPHSDVAGGEAYPVWRVRFELAFDRSVGFGLDANGDIVLGRGKDAPDFIDLSPYAGEVLGVSRRHLMLRPTATKLFVLDLGSTNGTWLNGRPVGVNTPYHLTDGDLLALGRLQFVVRIIRRPTGHTAALREKADLGEALIQMAQTITSQLELDEILSQALEMAMSLTAAGESAIWLVDEQTGELFLEAERGIQDEQIKRTRLPVTDTLAGEVIKTGKSLRASRKTQDEQIKIKTGHLVEAVIYAPLNLGGVAFGVLSAAHREPGKEFSKQDEKLLAAIADFAAIAVQNSRLYQATDKALARRVGELGALNEISNAALTSLDLNKVHEVLMEQVHRHWQLESATLWLLDERANALTSFSDLQTQKGREGTRSLRIGEGVVGQVAQTGEPQVVNDLQTLPDFSRDAESTLKLRAQSTVCVPLLIKEQVVGVLALSGKQKGVFTDEDIKRLQAFANPVATAIQNARMIAQAEMERTTVRATADMLSQPLMIIDEQGQLILSNQAADALLETVRQWQAEDSRSPGPLARLLEGLSRSVESTSDISVGDKTYVATLNHAPQVGTIIVMQDVTNVRRLERARTEFVEALSHDVRSPLQSIRGYAQLLQDERLAYQQCAGLASGILESSDRVLKMVNQLLDVALLSEAPQAPHSSCDLADMAASAIGDLKGVALTKSIDLDFEVLGTPYQIEGDAMRLYRSVLNLVDNAIKYSPEGSRVLVRLTFGGENVVLQVRDDGPGIPEEDLPHIFEKYFRAGQTSGKEPGIGLGLALVKATAEVHGGEVTVQNIESHGAEFVIKIPATLRVG
jgi:signal transduction histidine kinase